MNKNAIEKAISILKNKKSINETYKSTKAMNKLKATQKKETNIKKCLNERTLNSNPMLESERLKCRKKANTESIKESLN